MTDFTNINEMPEWPKQMACDKANARVAAGYRNGDWDALLKDTPAYIAARLAREQGAK